MATKTTVTYVDDIDGEEADKSVTFAVNGTQYEIDLTEAHVADLNDALKPFVDNARKIKQKRSTAAAKPSEIGRIREWAQQRGMDVSNRGRVPGAIMDAYHASQHGAPTS